MRRQSAGTGLPPCSPWTDGGLPCLPLQKRESPLQWAFLRATNQIPIPQRSMAYEMVIPWDVAKGAVCRPFHRSPEFDEIECG